MFSLSFLHQTQSQEHLIVSGSNRPISSLNVGEDVTLNCSVESYIPAEDFSWTKLDKDGHIQVLVFEKNKTIPPDERYRDRVEFFTDEIHKGNVSLRLKSVRAEDKGIYICHVNAGGVSASATVSIEHLSFSIVHKVILLLCISASGSALLFWTLICRSQNHWMGAFLHICLIFLPNIMMFVALILWGVFEGFLLETVACSALFLLRPNMLFRAGPHGSRVSINGWINNGLWSFITFIVFTAVVFPVLFRYAQDQSWNSFHSLLSLAGGTVGVSFLSKLLKKMIECVGIFQTLRSNEQFPRRSDTILPILSTISDTTWFITVFYFCLFFLLGLQVVMVIAALPLVTSTLISALEDSINVDETCANKQSDSYSTKSGFHHFILPINGFMVCFYLMVLQNDEDRTGWLCVVAFLQIQWTLMHLAWMFNNSVCHYSPRVYLFGSVGVVLLSSATLMTELVLKIFNGERAFGDLRTILFPPESLFALFMLISQAFAPGKGHVYKGCQIPACIILLILFCCAFGRSVSKYTRGTKSW